MNPSDVLLALEIGERARDLDDAVIAARGETQPVGGVAHKRKSRLIGLCHLVEHARRAGRVGQGAFEAMRPIALDLALARRSACEGGARCWVEKPCCAARSLCVPPKNRRLKPLAAQPRGRAAL
jgi:hypothetical protein